MIKRSITFVIAIIVGAALAHWVIYPIGKSLVGRMGQDLSVFVLSLIIIGAVSLGAWLWYRRVTEEGE